MRERVAELEEELLAADALLKVKQRVDELEMEVKCKDALIAARVKREAEEDRQARERAVKNEKADPDAGTNLASKLGGNWVSVDVGCAAGGAPGPVSTRARVMPVTKSMTSPKSRVPSRAMSSLPIHRPLTGASRPPCSTRRSASVCSTLRHLPPETPHQRPSLVPPSLQLSNAPPPGLHTLPSARQPPASAMSGLATMDGVTQMNAGGFTRFHNKAGVIMTQKSIYGQSAGMGMVMHPPKPHRRVLQGPRVPRQMDMRILPLNGYEPMYKSTHESLLLVGDNKSHV